MSLPKGKKPVIKDEKIKKADKVLSDLTEAREKRQKKYNQNLNKLHRFFDNEETPDFKSQDKLLEEICSIQEQLSLQTKSLASRIFYKVARFISPNLAKLHRNFELQKRINQVLIDYVRSLMASQISMYRHKREFDTQMLRYTQQIAPLIFELNNEVSRRDTVFPIERMDIIFTELVRQIEQIKSDIERLRRKTSQIEES